MEANELSKSVLNAFWRPAARAAVKDLYASLEAEIAQKRPRCEMSGRCCNFDEYGHRLYVTTLELAVFLYDYLDRPLIQLRQLAENWDGQTCPFQKGKLCSVHTMRPMGCRLFFCDPSSNQWQNDQYEQFHCQLKRLHEVLIVPYFYVEWRTALSMLGFK
jgi:Fe-S-cluster containining protein